MSLKSAYEGRLSGVDEELILSNGREVLQTLLADPSAFDTAKPEEIRQFRVFVSAQLKQKSSVSVVFGCALASLVVRYHKPSLVEHGSTWSGILLPLLDQPHIAASAKEAVIQCLVTIYKAINGNAELVREVISPSVPVFCKSLLALLSKGAMDRPQVALDALVQLQSVYPNSCRPSRDKCRETLLTYLNTTLSEAVVTSCAQGLAVLPFSAPKDTDAEEWQTQLALVLQSTNVLLSQFLENVEEFTTYDDARTAKLYLSSISQHNVVSSLIRHFVLIRAFLGGKTKSPVLIPTSKIMTVVSRILGISRSTPAQFNTETRKLRFHRQLECVQLEATKCASTLVSVLGKGANISISSTLLHHVKLVIAHSQSIPLRSALLQLTALILKTATSIPALFTTDVSLITKCAMQMVIADDKASSAQRETANSVQTVVASFLEQVVVSVPDLPSETRAQIERYAILANVPALLEQSSLYPAKTMKYSILPMVARIVQNSPLISTLIHPRLPPPAVTTANVISPAKFSNPYDEEVFYNNDRKRAKLDVTEPIETSLDALPSETVQVVKESVASLPVAAEPSSPRVLPKEQEQKPVFTVVDEKISASEAVDIQAKAVIEHFRATASTSDPVVTKTVTQDVDMKDVNNDDDDDDSDGEFIMPELDIASDSD